jgi:alpha-tubulin suppressor-like RCC1 family protein
MARSTTMVLRLGALSFAVILGCAEDGRHVTEAAKPDAAFSAMLSDPRQSSGPPPEGLLGEAQGSSSPTAGDIVYVSLPPGTIPGGVRVLVRNLETAFARTESLVDGGLDPVTVPASVGDRLTLAATLGNGATLNSVTRVPARRRPSVVRTVPPRGKTDVPLNSIIVVVFSEPIDAATVTQTSIRLAASGRPVSGQAVLAPDHLRIEFRPDQQLSPNTSYTLLVAADVADLNGDRLEQSLQLPFMTGSAAAVIDTLAVQPSGLTLAPGETLQLTTWAADASGNESTSLAVTWSSADPTVATVSAVGAVTGVRLGTTTITASAHGERAAATINVVELVFASVSAGVAHTCGLTTSGMAYCWGGGEPGSEMGELGIGLLVSSPTPTAVIGGLKFVQISSGGAHTCALTADGEAYCWGNNRIGQLGAVTEEGCEVSWGGFGPYPCSTRPVAVVGGLRFTSISAGAGHTCGLTSDGAAYCWGNNRAGGLGNGTTASSATPVAVAGGLTFASITAGRGKGTTLTCGVTRQGQAYCWGTNAYGQLGIGSRIGPESCPMSGQETPWWQCSTVPVAVVSTGLAFATVRAGIFHVCGLTTSGTTHCWGMLGSAAPEATVPVALPADRAYEAIELFSGGGVAGICLIANGGTAYCRSGWESDLRALPVPGSIAFATLSLGSNHTCGVTSQGKAYCWGSNELGQLGSGSLSPRSEVPVRVAGQSRDK